MSTVYLEIIRAKGELYDTVGALSRRRFELDSGVDAELKFYMWCVKICEKSE